ncbi:hypothetical protein ACIODS_25550 [Micromonospora chalcea]|uniref:hypothetical protein n=1 Tax=Micromonospora chalcea TaxID=1874 RepID=UPI0038155C7A
MTQQHSIAQRVAPEFQPLAEAVVTILQQLPGYGRDQQDIEAAANEVLAEVQQEQPEPGQLRRGVAMLKGFLFPIAKEAATEEARQLAQQGLDHISAAIGSVL